MNVIYQVAAIVGRRVKKGKVEYRVRWKGFPPEEDTWEPSYGLRDSCFPLIRSFNAEHKKRREPAGEKAIEMTTNRSPSPSQKPSPSVCSSDQLSLVSVPSSPIPSAQTISPPVPLQRSSKAPVKRSPTKTLSCPPIISPSGQRRKKVLVVFNSTSCDSPPPPPPNEGKKRDGFPFLKAASDPTKTVLQRETVKTVDITSPEHKYRANTSTNPVGRRRKVAQVKLGNVDDVSEVVNVKRRKYERKKPLKTKEKKKATDEKRRGKPRKNTMNSGKKTKEYIRLKCKSLKKMDKTKLGFKRHFEPPFHQRQLELAMKKEKRNLPVIIVYALDRIKKMKRRGDVENIYDIVSRMDPDLMKQKEVILHTVSAMEAEGLLLRWEGSGNCSYRVSLMAIEILNIDNSDGYLNVFEKKTPPVSPSKFEKPTGGSKRKEMKKEGGPGRKRKTNETVKEAVDLVLPPAAVKKRKMLEESSDVSASSSSGPPTDASYQVKETKSTSSGNHSNASSTSSSQTLINKACNIIESIQSKTKTNTHMYVVGKHVILVPPSVDSADRPVWKEMKNLPHKRFSSNGSSTNGSSNGNLVHSEPGQTGQPVFPLERRISVRKTESAFRYKEIMVKRQDNLMEIALQSTVGIMRNVFTATTLQELSSTLQSAVYDPECRLVVLTGSDLVFSHGIDLTQVSSTGRRSQALVETLRSFLITLVNFPKPVVAVVNGPAIGLGAAVLPLCDVVYASDKAVLQLPYCYLGQTPEGGSSFTLPKVMGPALAADMFMSARRLTAKEACERGLVSDVFWPSKLMLQTLTRCRRIAQCPPKSLESTKCIIRSQQREKIIYAIESECSMLIECWESVECKQKIQEFLNSRFDSLL